MSGDDGQWEVVPSYLDVLRGVYNVCHYGLYVTNGSESVSASAGPHRRPWLFIPLEDVFVVLVLAVLWTLVRRLLTDRVFKPLGWWLSLEPSNVAKLPESAWKLLYYGCVWLLTVYIVVLQGKYRFFQQPFSVWDDLQNHRVIASDIWWLYAIQSSYYVHGMYAVLYQDLWRKDSAVMLGHHSLTLVLLGMSYTFRCHNIGVLVLVLHDLSDVLLEFSKLNVYLKVRAGRKHVVHDRIASAAFVCFAITCTGLFVKQVFPAHYLFFLGLLSVLLVMNIYWFGMIVLFAVRVVTGDIQELDDTREYDVAEKLYSSTASNGRHRESDEAVVLRPASQDDGAKPENGFQNGWHGGVRERHTQPQPQNGS
ncbi:hypothetical protein HPB52_019258 [Rhipicephalus sanguineus]|uniref:TLC domain-containing protein n=1 Tax=Rhipicephalus sanguineus TaxID=34632 RepID=A0A9D4PSA0_RHISA|nr:hypothetical protein HPB52_019258 [Rhipicephalus sanguineus]